MTTTSVFSALGRVGDFLEPVVKKAQNGFYCIPRFSFCSMALGRADYISIIDGAALVSEGYDKRRHPAITRRSS